MADDYGAYDFAASGDDAYAVWREWAPAGGNDIYLTYVSGTSVGDPVIVNDPPGKISATPTVAADGDRGTEQLLHGTASARLRVVGDSGIGVEVSRYLRRAEVGGEIVREADSVVRFYLMLLGGA